MLLTNVPNSVLKLNTVILPVNATFDGFANIYVLTSFVRYSFAFRFSSEHFEYSTVMHSFKSKMYNS